MRIACGSALPTGPAAGPGHRARRRVRYSRVVNLDFPPDGAEWTFFVCTLVILVGPLVAQRVRLPGMVGIILAGVAIGPNVLDWVPREGTVESIGQLGLLLLMFLAGLELDLDEFARRRVDAVRFGLLTFLIPITLGTIVGAAIFGYAAGAAVLFGSLWASHTLVSYPIARNQGLAGERPVSMAVSGTVLTDTLALSVLAVVVGTHDGDSSGAVILGELMLGMAILLAVAFLLVPRLTAWFFAGPGQDRALRFVAILTVFTGVAVVATFGGLEGIVGAFFAGLAVNRLVPNRGPLMERLEFFGSSLLVPFFLISTGMLIDPAKFTEARTLALGAASLAVVVVGKAAAAIVAGRWSDLSRDGMGLVFSLTVAQAAATLAAVIIGLEAGIFDDDLVNAALVVVLVTLVIAPVGTTRFAARVTPAAPHDGGRLGESVLVPLVDDAGLESRVHLASLLARADTGVVVPLALASETAGPEVVVAARQRLARARGVIAAAGVESEGGVRVTESPAAGTLRAAAEHDVSCIVVSWQGAVRARGSIFGGAHRGLLTESQVPILAVSPGSAEPAGIVLALSRDDVLPGRRIETGLAVRTARLLALALDTDVRVIAPDPEAARPLLVGLERAPTIGYGGSLVVALDEAASPADVVVFPARVSREALAGDAGTLAARGDGPTVVLAAAASGAGRQVPTTRVLAGRS